MLGRLLAVLAALLCLLGLAWGYQAKPRNLHPSKLEKTCPFGGAWVPCFIRDEALQQTWEI